jgi:uncharacterized membrane protein
MVGFHVSNGGLAAASLFAASHAVQSGPQAVRSALAAVSGCAQLVVIYAGASNATIHAV